MPTAEERLLEWLRDAYAMEEQAELIFRLQIGRLQHYPEIKTRFQQHLQETRRHAKLVERCIKARGGDLSGIKDIGGKIVAAAQCLSGIVVGDEVVKGALASYTFKHMEIASYRLLIAAAEAVNDIATAHTCVEILLEEEAMALWIKKYMPVLVRTYFTLEEISDVVPKL
jgi:ferritin-like metal-binding protein YciE